MTMHKAWMSAGILVLAATTSAQVQAAPVVYTLETVAAGSLGNRHFNAAVVTIRMRADTRNVQQQSGTNGAPVFTVTGPATVTVDDGDHRVVANFAKDQIYVRYDTYSGVVGFGSSISPTYPVALGCGNDDCTVGDWTNPSLESNYPQAVYNGTAQALADIAAQPGDNYYVSWDLLTLLPSSLSQSTLLTGRAQTCVVAYQPYNPCLAKAPKPLLTDGGNFYLQGEGGLGTGSNTGAMQVEVLTEDE